MARRRTEEDRFAAKHIGELNSGCWLWIGSAKKAGYGNMWFRGRNDIAHRVSYILFKGEIPSGLDVCHSCDMPSCVNPDHLWLGTRLDNIRDCASKGRIRRGTMFGERNPGSKLSNEAVSDIRNSRHVLRSEMAKKYNVSVKTISRVRTGETWV